MKILRRYPESMVIKGEDYRFEKILKDDFFSVNVLYRNQAGRRYVLKLSDFRFILGLLFRPFAMLMSGHEYTIYRMVDGLPGVPELGPRWGLRGYFHEFIEGKTLHELGKDAKLPDDFFDRLGELIRAIHERRIFYMDLNKQGNIILGDDGKPWLIDYQICMHFKGGGLFGRWSDRIFKRLIQEDIYHLYKHKKRLQPQRLTDDEARLAVRSEGAKKYNRFLGAPYRRFKRKLYPSGSNEIIWYKWKKIKDQSKRMP
ncbi:MAG: hypothetical protein KDH88_00980 [Chromatiales bacterium]|nr:hypothetical protein [Chromatiales bacterium]